MKKINKLKLSFAIILLQISVVFVAVNYLPVLLTVKFIAFAALFAFSTLYFSIIVETKNKIKTLTKEVYFSDLNYKYRNTI